MATVVSHSDSPFRTEAVFSPGAVSVIDTSRSLSKNNLMPKKAASPKLITLLIYYFWAPNSPFNTYSAIMDRLEFLL